MAKPSTSDTAPPAPPAEPQRPKRTRKGTPRPPRQLLLAEATEDETTKQPVYALLDVPPLPSDKPITAGLIKAATQRAVYEDGKKGYGNRRLVVLQVLDAWEVRYEERVALMPPPSAETK